jgi:hypothetical protein
MKPTKGNPASAQPMKACESMSKRGQALLAPVRNQIVLAAKGQADKTRSIQRGGI